MVGSDLSGIVLDGRYRLVSLLGAGGMGQIYEGTHFALDRRVAIKVLPSELSTDARFRARFSREARAVARITHRNVVQIMDFGETPTGLVYFVMEFLDGRDLGAVLRDTGRLPWPRARHLLLQAASALKAAHAHGIIHRDIKPGNCFVLDLPHEGLVDVVKLLDFGIAKVLDGTPLTLSPLTGGEIMGTASYMAPEQAQGEPLDARSDVYSLGIMAYEMLTGQVPFVGVNFVHVVTRHIHDRPAPLHRAVPEIMPDVEELVLRALAKDPADRFQSMADLEAALLAVPNVSFDSMRTRRLMAAGAAERVDGGPWVSAGGRPGEPTVVLREPVGKATPARLEEPFEDAETPDPMVLRPRFGEPYPVRVAAEALEQRFEDDEGDEGETEVAEAEVAEVAEGDEAEAEAEDAEGDEAEGDETEGDEAEVDEPESEALLTRVRLVPELVSALPSEPFSPTDTVIQAPAATSVVGECVAKPEGIGVEVAPTEEPTIHSVRMAAELDSAMHESLDARPARSRGWFRVVGLMLLLGSIATVAILAMSNEWEAQPAAVATGIETRPRSEPVTTRGKSEPATETSRPGVPSQVAVEAVAELPKAADEPSEAKSAETHELVEATAESFIPVVPADSVDAQGASRGGTSKAGADLAVIQATPRSPAKKPRPPKPPSVQPPHQTDECKQHVKQAEQALDEGNHREVITLTATSNKGCWPPAKRKQAKRLVMHMTALAEINRFDECVSAALGNDDLEVIALRQKCKGRI